MKKSFLRFWEIVMFLKWYDFVIFVATAGFIFGIFYLCGPIWGSIVLAITTCALGLVYRRLIRVPCRQCYQLFYSTGEVNCPACAEGKRQLAAIPSRTAPVASKPPRMGALPG